VTFNPAVLGLVVPFLLFVLLYFQRKRRHEQNRASESAAERLENSEPRRLLQELLQIEIDEQADTPETSFKAFLRGAPTRRLNAEFIAEVYHGVIGVVLLAFVAVLIIRDAVANAIVAYVLIAMVLLPLAMALALRLRRARSPSGPVRDALARVVRLHDLQYGAVIDRRWQVIATAGDVDRLQDAELAPLLLGRHGEAMRTYRALAWMPLPQIITMGQTEVIADKPSPALVVVVFRQRNTTFDDTGQHVAPISRVIHDEFSK
jgi:hypothetical protein